MRIWEADFLPFSLFFRVVTLAMSPKDDTFISGAVDDSIRLWDLRSPNCQVSDDLMKRAKWYYSDSSILWIAHLIKGMMKIQGHPVVAYDLTGAVFAVALNERGVILLYDASKFDEVSFPTSWLLPNNSTWREQISKPSATGSIHEDWSWRFPSPLQNLNATSKTNYNLPRIL